MKIGIVTLVSDNYGNKFQNYAVEQLLSEYGQVVTYAVDQKREKPGAVNSLRQKLRPRYIGQSLRSRMMYLYDVTNAQRSLVGNLLYVMTHRQRLLAAKKRRHQKFSAFQESFLHISDRIITHENCNEKDWNESHDYFVCGSDQIWNPNYGTTSDLAFLSFAKGKNIALAPSFGVSTIPKEVREDFGIWIDGIDSLSVREESGRQIIWELTGREAQVLLDPTMAIEPEQWASMARAPKSQLPEKYILTYFLGRVTKDYKKRIKNISQQMGLPVVNLFNIEEPQYYVFDPNEVLFAIQNASIVLTDSFHGSVFSILFQKDFLVFRRDEAGESMHSRLATLLGKFNLEDRLDDGRTEPTGIGTEKWCRVHQILSVEKMNTREYLSKAITKE